MGTMDVSVHIKNYNQMMSDIKGIEDGVEKALSNTVKDMKSRAPGWVASAVTEAYNIKKGEITPAKEGKPKKMVGDISIRGKTIETLQLVYQGRVLTPTHFGMKPGARPKGATTVTLPNGKRHSRPKPYTVTAEIKKGARKSIGGNRKGSKLVFLWGNNGSKDIPFQRKVGDSRLPIYTVKTLSLPQMITNDKVAEDIRGRLNGGLNERLEHNISRQLGK